MARVWLTSGVALLAVFAGCVFAGCDPCETDACDDAQEPRSHAKISQGVVGVSAFHPDNCKDECCTCSYSGTELRLIEATERVTRKNAASIAAEGKSSKTIHAQHEYAQPLDPGDYLLCADRKKPVGDVCAGLHITAGDVFTVNVQYVIGPTSLIVFGPDDEEPRDDLVFVVQQ